MAYDIKRLGKFALPAAAMTLSVFGLAAGSNAQSNAKDDPRLICEISVSKGRYGHTYEGVIHASNTVRGTYELSIAKRGSAGHAMISQSGDFHLAAGRSETLGQATFGGLPPESVDAELTVKFDGQTLACNNNPEI